VYAILRRLVRDPDLAEELAQETFVRAFSGIGRFRGESSVGTWLIQIAVNLARDHRRAEGLRPVLVPIEQGREVSGRSRVWGHRERNTDPLHTLEHKELVATLEQELARLPGDYREVFLLKHVHGHSYEEIARMTGDSVGTLKVRAHRSRRMLRERLAARTGAEESDGSRSGTLSRR